MRYCKIIIINLKVELTELVRAVFMYKSTAFVIYFIEHISLGNTIVICIVCLCAI